LIIKVKLKSLKLLPTMPNMGFRQHGLLNLF
jgi:hypothetical protein